MCFLVIQDAIGVGPWQGAWPSDSRLDAELLTGGDKRNVIDEYRYWSESAIKDDLAIKRERQLHVAIENFTHDFNIGSIVRTANAFNAAAVHIVGDKRYNRRGAMCTDRYLSVRHWQNATELAEWAFAERLPIIGIDNLPGSEPIEEYRLPRDCVLLFGTESGGLTADAQAASEALLHITQSGSTRSINAGAAAAIAMYAWATSSKSER
ncbi:MAG: rRNA methyltransferase [Promicromonosporaceae bacterium]|nr:rRNA methyltransferase [Promicromonosporaceae bacterium]